MTAELPLILVASLPKRTLMAMTSASTSPFTGGQQVQDWGGRYWLYEIEMARLQGRNGMIMDAFLNGLGGMAGKFVFRDQSIRQTLAGSPQVAFAGQSGTSLVVDGWPANATVMQVGNFFSIGSGAEMRLHQVDADITSNWAGFATLTFHPPLRSSPADNAVLNITDPGVVLRLAEPAPARIERVQTYRFTLSAREAI